MVYFFLLDKDASSLYLCGKKAIMRRVLALFLFVPFALIVNANGLLVTDEVDVLRIQSGTYNGCEPRSESISADITGNTLTITFNDNVGIAHIIIKDSNGVYIDRENVFSTPDYATFFINDAGYYRMDITLSNGEQYYGYFRVEN